ncbi:hypothetical protein COU37_01750 [Candidatus Micrarchaeota archaeon CG10_big_fil_rev_8_21_14_0_10_45_29]|nr:MAG: hypothetical protein COU37_01750 [Candidatus Micrarchaeota archaeon CG10_big_fil_rev_8_21_14_0_10_45_29]
MASPQVLVEKAASTLKTGGMQALYIAGGIALASILQPFVAAYFPTLGNNTALFFVALGIVFSVMTSGAFRQLGLGMVIGGVLTYIQPYVNQLARGVAAALPIAMRA